MRAEYVEAVLDVVELIPAGQVLSYGDIAALLESGGPRQVGSVMSHHGSAVPWWRVIRAAGLPPVCHDAKALAHYREEATALRGETGGEHPSWRVDMAQARWNPTEPEFDAIDAIAARLHAAVGPEAGPAAKMSVPRDGLQA
jgi:alkylated DNA nucleotide flippase Atl1